MNVGLIKQEEKYIDKEGGGEENVQGLQKGVQG